MGLTFGHPTALELVYMPWRSSISVEAKLGTIGFTNDGYGELGFFLHSPEILRRPIYSVRLAVGGGAFAMSERWADMDAAGEVGAIGTASLRIDMSAMPVQMVVSTSVRRALIERNERIADDFNIGVTGGLRYIF